jgi:hypothetical protein
MRDDQDERDEEQGERPRPKVVDKRISARPAPDPAPPGAPDATAEATVGTVPEAPLEETAPPEAPGGEQVWTPEQEAEARQVADEIARTPSIEWVINVAATLANVAGAKLDRGAAADAQLAIDALAGIVNAVAPRLAGAERPLRQLLADLQLAYAQRATGPGPTT